MYDKIWTVLFLDCSAEANVYNSNPMSDQIDVMREKSKTKQMNNLTCHVCHSESQKECLNLQDANGEIDDFIGFPQACGMNDTSCMVKTYVTI